MSRKTGGSDAAADGGGSKRRPGASEALLAAARSLLDAGEPEDVGLRQIARVTGVSAAAAYKHFADKDDLMANVAAQGFRELRAALRGAAAGADPIEAEGLAYLDFALANRGLFRLMFGPRLSLRERHSELGRASAAAFGTLGLEADPAGASESGGGAARSRMALVHGVACLAIAGVISAADARDLVRVTTQARAGGI